MDANSFEYLNMFVRLLLIFVLSVTSCASAQKVLEINFTTSTRGYQKEITLTDHIMSVSETDRSGSETTHTTELNPEERDQLQQLLQTLNMETIPSLESPTKDRGIDRALISTLTFSTQDAKTYTHQFDDETPNTYLQPILDFILAVEKK